MAELETKNSTLDEKSASNGVMEDEVMGDMMVKEVMEKEVMKDEAMEKEMMEDEVMGRSVMETEVDAIGNNVMKNSVMENEKMETSGLVIGAKGEQDDIPGIRPRTKSRTSDPREGVDLALGKGQLEDLEPITVSKLFKRTVERIPDSSALMFKDSPNGKWQSISYSKYYKQVLQAAKSFIKLGLKGFHSVCIIGFNSPEWFISNLGAMFAGGLAAGIYTTNSPEACHYIASNCKANVIVVEDKIQLGKILQIRDRLPDLKAIVQYKEEVSDGLEDVYNWKQFMDLGKDIETSVVEEIIDAQRPEQCALLVYTSGTTGNPKGVMLSHDNLTWTANCLRESYGNVTFGNEHVVTYLPLSHMAAQIVDVYLFITIGGTVHFAQRDALQGSLGQTLKEAMPTIFFGVPRVFEKIMESMQEKLSVTSGIKKKIVDWGARKGIKGNYKRQNSENLPIGWSMADKLVFKKVREMLGFQRCKIFVVGSAPTPPPVHDFFMSYNMPLMELYGMSESCGPQTFNVDTFKGKWRTGSCGPLVIGAHLKIDKPSEEGEGEICYYGRHVFMGYLNNEEKTKEAIDDDGWLHSGDIGRVDKDGFLYITGRIKEIIITTGGENVPPAPIESRVKFEIPFLNNVFIIGEGRKYLTCLVTLISKMDSDSGEPLDELAPKALRLLESMGCSCTKVSEVVSTKNLAVYTAIKEGLVRSNEDAISHAQRIQKFIILPKDFSIPGGELGPTLKVRRQMVIKKYEAVINAMYDNK